MSAPLELVSPPTLGDLLKYEAPLLYSRGEITVAAGQRLKLGTVLAVNPQGKHVMVVPGGDGTGPAVAVLMHDVDSTAGDADALAIQRHAIVASRALVWPTEVRQSAIDTCIHELEQHGILVRSSA